MAITLDGTTGITTPGLTNTGTETIVNLTTTGNTTLGDATTDTLTVGVTGIVKDASGNVGIGTASPSYRLSAQTALTGTTAGSNTVGSFYSNGNGYDSNIRFGDNTNSAAVLGYLSGNMYMFTGGAERMRIDSSGNLIVGATSSVVSGRMEVTSTSNTSIPIFANLNAASSTAYPAFSCRKYDNSNTTSQIYISFAFNQGVSGAGGIQGNGATGVQFYSSSDARLKENIVELEPQLANIMALKPSKFDFIDGPKDCTGFIAQEMETVYPDAIGETPDGYKTIGGISIMETRLIKAIQEQQALITQLQADVAALKGA